MIKRLLFWIKTFKKVNIIKSLYYSHKFKGKVICGRCKITINGGGKISMPIGSKLYVGVDYTYPVPTVLDIYGGELRIKGTVSINRGSKVVIGKDSILEIGDGTYINEGAKVYCREGIKVGSYCAIGFDSLILDSDIHKIFNHGEQSNTNSRVIIGDKVWIGAKTLVLKGAVIEENTILGANSIVSHKCLSNHIYAGSPIKELSEFENWK